MKAIAVKAYTIGLSLRIIERFSEELGYKVSREAVGKWFSKAGEIFSRLKKRKRRGSIAVDETIVFNFVGKPMSKLLEKL